MLDSVARRAGLPRLGHRPKEQERVSEDSLSIQFEFSSESVKRLAEATYARHVPESVRSSRESSISYSGGTATYFADGFSLPRESLQSLLCDLESDGAQAICAEVWIDSLGEHLLFAWASGRLQASPGKLTTQTVRSEVRVPPAVALDFGKQGSEHTLAVCLHVPACEKRARLAALFTALRKGGARDRERLDLQVQALAKRSKQFEIGWLRHREKRKGAVWFESCSHDLQPALTGVAEAGETLHLSFDLARTGDPSEVHVEDSIYFPFYQLDGVTKVWVKHFDDRPARHGWYCWFPNGCDESHFLEWRGLNDRDWPEPGPDRG